MSLIDMEAQDRFESNVAERVLRADQTRPGRETRRPLAKNEKCGVIVEMNGYRYHFHDRHRVSFESETTMMQNALMVYDIDRNVFVKHRFSGDADANRQLELLRDLGVERIEEIINLFDPTPDKWEVSPVLKDYI